MVDTIASRIKDSILDTHYEINDVYNHEGGWIGIKSIPDNMTVDQRNDLLKGLHWKLNWLSNKYIEHVKSRNQGH